MVDFVILPSQYDNIPDLILSEVGGFSESVWYQRLSSKERRIPGLVCAALTLYLEDLARRSAEGTLITRELKALEDGFRVIELLAASSEERIRNVVVTEILENIQTDDHIRKLIEFRLGPETRSLYEKWIK